MIAERFYEEYSTLQKAKAEGKTDEKVRIDFW